MIRRPRLLDLFCGAGGASMGYAAAGFDVVGVDVDGAALAEYPFPFVQADVMAILAGEPVDGFGGFFPATWGVELDETGRLDLDGFDVIAASPPCQAYSAAAIPTRDRPRPRLVEPVVDWLVARWAPRPFVVENVEGAPLPGATMLCGSMWPLRTRDDDGSLLALRRHRLFASNVAIPRRSRDQCDRDRRTGITAGVYGGGSTTNRGRVPRAVRGGYTPSHKVRGALMGIDWMSRDQLVEAIPPAYTEHVGTYLIRALDRQVAA